MSGESTAVLSQADSVAKPSSGQNSSAQHATTASLHLPRVAPARGGCHRKLARSFLKMKRVDPARARVSALHGVLMPAASRATAASAARSSLLPSMDQFFSVRSAIHLHGSTPHRKSGVVSGHRAERHTAEPIRANTTTCLAIRDGRAGARKNGGDRCIGIGCRHDISSGRDALQGAPGEDRRQVADIGSTNDFHRAVTSGVMAGPIRGSGLHRRVTTATPFAPEELAIRRANGSRQLTPAWVLASRRRIGKRRSSQGLLGGIESALDAAPFPHRRRQAICTRG